MGTYRFSDLIDVNLLQRLADLLYNAAGFIIGIVDVNGEVLVKAGWQEICTRYHREHPETCERCRESDAFIQSHLDESGPVQYKCQNGLWDVGLPIIISGQHLATLFLGQFFYEDEEVDIGFFRKQAHEFGFDESAYLEALSKVPRFSRDKVDGILQYYSEYVHLLAEQGKIRLDLLQELDEHALIEKELEKHRDHLEELVEAHTGELRFQAHLLDEIQDAITATDLDGRITWVNRASCKAAGRSRNELIGLSVESYSGEDSDTDIQQNIIETVRNRGEWRGEVENVAPNGRLAILDARIWLVRDKNGQPTGMCGISTDITERKNIEEALRKKEADFRQLVVTSTQAMIISDLNHKVLLMNRKFTAVTGYTMEDFDNLKQWFPLACPDENYRASVEREWLRRIENARNHGETEITPMEVRVRAKKGRNLYLEIGQSQISDLQLVIFNDLTYRKEAEEKLRESKERFQSIIDHSNAGIVFADPDGAIVDANAAFLEILGYSLKQIRTMNFRDFTLPEDLEAELELFSRLKNNEDNNYRLEKRYITSRQDIVWVDASISVIRNQDGQPENFVGVVVDITRQKQAQTERLLIEKQMQEAQKLESLGILAGGIAHDFNNILTAILGNIELLNDEMPEDSPCCLGIREVEKAARRAADLTGQMLVYSGKRHFVVKPLNLSQLVRGMSALLESTVPDTVCLQFQLDESIPVIRADAEQMQQVILNLVTNAGEACSEQGMATVIIRTASSFCNSAYLTEMAYDALAAEQKKPVEGEYVWLEVADTGCGMNSETRKRLFEPFFTTKFTGRGLGMAALLGIVRGHGGIVHITSAPGKGSTIRVLFPVPAAQPEQ